MKIKIIASSPVNSQEEITQYIGNIYEPVNLKSYYDKDIIKEMKELKEIAVYLDPAHRQLSILNQNEYEVIEGV